MSILDVTQLTDEDLRAALFDAAVERIDARAHEDPSVTVVNRMPTTFAVSRRGYLLTLSQGVGHRLLRGDLKGRNRGEKPRTFHVIRARVQSRLALAPGGIEGTPDEVLDRILTMFLEWTAAERETGQARTEPSRDALSAKQPVPRQDSQKGSPAPQTIRTERRPTAPRSVRSSAPAPAEVIPDTPPAAHIEDAHNESEKASAPPAPTRETTTATLRTYQMLFETARRQLEQARALPAGSRPFLVSAGVFVAFTAEAFFNDLGSRLIPAWSQLQRLDPREKAEVLNVELFRENVDWSTPPFQSVAAALGFRRSLANAHAETLPFDHVRTAVPRTRRTAWQAYSDVPTIERWIGDVDQLIQRFSSAHDAAAGPDAEEQPEGNPST